jgi:anti-anti-sigma factor
MVRPTEFKVERSQISNSACRLSVTGELDLATVPKLEDEANKALLDGAKRIEIDLANLGFIDSTGLRMFLQLNERAASEGWSLLMVKPSEPVRTILQITGAGDELPISEES